MKISLHSPLQWFRWIARNSRRLAILLVGFAFLGAGAAMLVLPGPGIIVVLLGLAILATEFTWAERALDRSTGTAVTALTKVTSRRSGRFLLGASAVSMVMGGAGVLLFATERTLLGASALLAGAAALGVLLPRVQGWMARRFGVSDNTDTAEPISLESATTESTS